MFRFCTRLQNNLCERAGPDFNAAGAHQSEPANPPAKDLQHNASFRIPPGPYSAAVAIGLLGWVVQFR